MKSTHAALALSLVVGMFATTTVSAQQARTVAAKATTAADDVLKRQVGTWNTTVTVYGAQGKEEKVYKSVSTSTLGCGGRCLIWDLKSEFAPGQPFHGHGIELFDPVTKKYVSTWTDASTSGFTTQEYTYNTTTNKFTGTFAAKDARGVATRTAVVGDFTDPNVRVMTMTGTGRDGLRGPVIKCAMVRAQ